MIIRKVRVQLLETIVIVIYKRLRSSPYHVLYQVTLGFGVQDAKIFSPVMNCYQFSISLISLVTRLNLPKLNKVVMAVCGFLLFI